jgi:hypothetical protein
MITVKCNDQGQAFVVTNLPFSVRLVGGRKVVAGSELCHEREQHVHDFFAMSCEINDRAVYEHSNQ